MTDDIKDVLVEGKEEAVEDSVNTITEHDEKDIPKTKKSVNRNTESSKKENFISLHLGNRVRIKEKSKWTSGEYVPEWVLQKTLYVRSVPENGKCIVSISQQDLSLGSGEVYTKDLIKVKI